jgi:hypothetical protein
MVFVFGIVILRRGRKGDREVPDRDQQQPLPQDIPDPSEHGDEATPWVEYNNELDGSQDVHQLPDHGDQRTSWAEYNNELDGSQDVHQLPGQKDNVPELAARGPPPAELAATLSRPWNEPHADPVYYHQLPTGENTSELP